MQDGITKIKVVGVGGAGGNVVSHMMADERRIRGVEFIAVNTDAQDLDYAVAHKKIYIGKALTHGLGAGMNPEIGKQAAEEGRSELGEALDGADIIFITAGFGGGTGTGASPVVAEIAKEKGILTIGVVTKPFAFEGVQRMNIAQDGLARLKEKVDSLVVIPNDKIFSLIDKETTAMRAFGYIDDVLRNAVKSVAELINMPGLINVDFSDIETTLRDAGTTLIGIGFASGQDRAVKAATAAIHSPLLEVSVEGAKGVLFSIAGSKDLKMSEINDIAKTIAENLDANARIIFGAYHDKSLKEKSVKVMVIATGFNGVFSGTRMTVPSLFVSEPPMKKEQTLLDDIEKQKPENTEVSEKGKKDEKSIKQAPVGHDTWEIPSFLRKKKK
ncbi:MAG: cell division protein FtsZ [Candidatus Jorgensenbacteria bacterium]|nr:cell division protein FtsZ [Candidatus Jorgensenbacteria bacterium]